MRKTSVSHVASAVALLAAGLGTLATGCPFKAEEFQRLCDKATDCADGNPCTDDTCTGGVCENSNKAAHTVCGASKDEVCDGEGSCIQCVSDTDCTKNHPDKPICDLKTQKCVSCTDGIKNGKETDIDCGGPDCGACLGQPCDTTKPAALQCGGGTSCAAPENICCDKPCGATCQACSKAKTGQPDGTCASIPLGQDPDGECASQGGCGATEGRCACHDEVNNGMETDVDCGGPTCPKCGGGKTCGSDTDCDSGGSYPVCTVAQHVCCNNACADPCSYCNATGTCSRAVGRNDPTCATGLVCGPLGAGCVHTAGATCTSNTSCLSGSCSAGKCAKGGTGIPCNTPADCFSGNCMEFACQ